MPGTVATVAGLFRTNILPGGAIAVPETGAAGFVSAGTPETGLWCSRCLLPSRVRVPIYLTSEAGSSLLGVWDACEECDSD